MTNWRDLSARASLASHWLIGWIYWDPDAITLFTALGVPNGLGYYITPAIVGGPTDQMISGFIERAINSENNWGKASALGVILLTATLILDYVYNKLVGIDRMKLG